MGRIPLMIGGFGQAFLFGSLIPGESSPLLDVLFLLPFLIIFFINFLAIPLFTYKAHRRITLVTLFVWAAGTITAEILWLAGLFARLDSTQIAVAQVFMNFGWLTVVPEWLCYARRDPDVRPNPEEKRRRGAHSESATIGDWFEITDVLTIR